MISKSQLEEIVSRKLHQEVVDGLNAICDRYDINTISRQACFIGQVAHESGGFRYREENLNYSAKGLRSVFGRYFTTDEMAQEYARQPERIANKVYANRIGNDDEDSGDGWKYRGRGYIQLTGRYNYNAYCNNNKIRDMDSAIKYLQTIEGAWDSAGWYWDKHDLNIIADDEDMKTITRKINGGYNGLEDRIKYFEKAKKVLTVEEVDIDDEEEWSDLGW